MRPAPLDFGYSVTAAAKLATELGTWGLATFLDETWRTRDEWQIARNNCRREDWIARSVRDIDITPPYRWYCFARTPEEAADLQALGWRVTDKTRRDTSHDQYSLRLVYESNEAPPVPSYKRAVVLG